MGNLKNSNNVNATYENLKPNDYGVYRFYRAFYKANENEVRRRQVDDKLLELESAVAVKNEIGGNIRIHSNFIFKIVDNSKDKSVEIDAIVCDDVELLDDSNNVCIVEAAYSPQSREVNILTGKLSKFMAYAKTDPYFRNVSHFIPVLAGRHWSNEMTSARAAKQWIVRPSGTGYEVIRALHTVARRIMK